MQTALGTGSLWNLLPKERLVLGLGCRCALVCIMVFFSC